MAKQQAPVVSSDDEEVIFDLTEIVQKGKAPLVSKPDVDFDSALSDLMGKTPAMKLDETPELEALFSGMDDVAPKRTLTFAEDDELDEPEAPHKPVSNSDDVDSLFTSLAEKSGKHIQPAADDVDSLLDSLMDDLNPPSTKASNLDQDISDDDLDDLLSSIEQDSKQTPKAVPAEKAPPADLDDLLAGLDFAAPDLKPAAKPQPAEKVAPVEKAAPAEKAPPADLDDLLAGLDFAAPDLKPAAKPQPAAKTVDSIDDLLAGLDNLSKPAPAAPVAQEASEPADDFDMPEVAAAPKPLQGRGIPDADLDDLLAGLDSVINPAKSADSATAKSTANGNERVDFGDLAAMLDGESVPDDGNNDRTAPDDPEDVPDGPVSFDKPAFNANDFDDLDALFAEKKPAPAAALREESAHISEAPTKQPSNAELELSKRLTELAERVEQGEAERNALQERVVELENRPAPKPQPDALTTLLEEGSPFCTQLMDLVRTAVAAEMQALASRVDASAQTLSELEARAVSTEGKLADVADVAAKALASTEMPEAPEIPQPAGLASVDLEPLAERLNALEGVVVRQGELDIHAEKLDVLEERVNGLSALGTLEKRVILLESHQRAHNSAADLLEIPKLTENPEAQAVSEASAPAAAPEEFVKLDQRLATLEARPYVPLETIQSAFDQMGEQLNSPLQQFQNRIALLEQRLADDALPRLAGDLLPFMSGSIDKAAAASAAKALREELEALMSEGGDDIAENEPGAES